MNRHSIEPGVPSSERGAALVEYVLLFSLIVLVCLASVTTFGGGVNDKTTDSSNRIVAATTP